MRNSFQYALGLLVVHGLVQLGLGLGDGNGGQRVTDAVQAGDQHLDGTVDGQNQGVAYHGCITGEADTGQNSKQDDGACTGSGGSALRQR